MNIEEFRKQAYKAVDWLAEYFQSIENYPVKSQVEPNDIYNQIPLSAPNESENFEDLFKDLNNIILPGITHWQHPHFHAYFPANSSYPSIIAEIITAGLGAQCMMWETSPAATELEQKMTEWLQKAMQLPTNWTGVIQDTASSATLTAILSAREDVGNNQINSNEKLRVYCSKETHSSVEKGAKIAGLGSNNVVKVETDLNMAMIPEMLETDIETDISNGYKPCCVVATLGTTSTLAFDPIQLIGEICHKYGIWLHIDAAYAGSALILPEMDWMRQGLNLADSFVFNPHKWLFTNFDCSIYYVKDKSKLIKTFEIHPEYLKSNKANQVNDYRNWSIQLGRRFRALKLWFVMRSFGINQMRNILHQHIEWATWLEKQMINHTSFELLTPRFLNVLVFRYTQQGLKNDDLNQLNEKILDKINSSGKAYLTHTKVKGKYAIRIVLGQTYLEKRHVEELWKMLSERNLIKTDIH